MERGRLRVLVDKLSSLILGLSWLVRHDDADGERDHCWFDSPIL